MTLIEEGVLYLYINSWRKYARHELSVTLHNHQLNCLLSIIASKGKKMNKYVV